jgi:hypothetical protein
MDCGIRTGTHTRILEIAMTRRPKSVLVKGACVSLLLTSAAAIADDPSVPTQIVDLANKVDGVHPGFRAFHAKGVVVEGTFKASAEAARLSGATLFSGSSIPVTCRVYPMARLRCPAVSPSSITCLAELTRTW